MKFPIVNPYGSHTWFNTLNGNALPPVTSDPVYDTNYLDQDGANSSWLIFNYDMEGASPGTAPCPENKGQIAGIWSRCILEMPQGKVTMPWGSG